MISVIDNGSGIPKDKRSKIFDPYFTTKEKGRGTGLGLSIMQGIVLQHKGAVSIESEQGEGSTFHIYPLVWKR